MTADQKPQNRKQTVILDSGHQQNDVWIRTGNQEYLQP